MEEHSVQSKMMVPMVATGIEEWHDFRGQGIDARQVGAFSRITAVTGERQIVGFVGSEMLLGDNVLDVVCQLAVLLSKQAVLTTIVRAAPDEVARRAIHG